MVLAEYFRQGLVVDERIGVQIEEIVQEVGAEILIWVDLETIQKVPHDAGLAFLRLKPIEEKLRHVLRLIGRQGHGGLLQTQAQDRGGGLPILQLEKLV